MNTPTPQPARSLLPKWLGDLRFTTWVLLGSQAGVLQLDVWSRFYYRVTNQGLAVLGMLAVLLPAYVLCGILGLAQAIRCLLARKHVILNAVLLGTSLFVVTASPPLMLADQLCEVILPPQQRFLKPGEAKLLNAVGANMKAKYAELTPVFQTPVRVVAVHDQYLTLGDGHVVFLLGPVLTFEDLDKFVPFANERLVGKDIAMRLPDFDDFEATYYGNVLPNESGKHEKIPVVIVLDGELINAKFGSTGEWLVKKYGPRH